MKNKLLWMFMLMAVLALVSSNARAVWDPDGSELIFNLDFETNSDSNGTTTTDATIGSRTGTLIDYNTLGYDVLQENGIRGISADFNQHNDAGEGASPNDCAYSVAPSSQYDYVFEFGGTGWPDDDATTFAFWFNMSNNTSATFLRREQAADPNFYYEIRAIGGKLEFREGQNALRFETASTLDSLGIANNTWHHAVVTVDRSNCIKIGPTLTQSSKMYIDGLETPVIITYLKDIQMYVDPVGQTSPLLVGAGERSNDGLMDEVRIYNRSLSALEVSLLYQYDTTVAHTTAILPIPRSSNVRIDTDVNWVKATGATAQVIYFGDDPNDANLPQVASGVALTSVSNATLGGPFPLNKTYYWYVKSTVGGSDINSPVYSFTTETGQAFDPVPADGAIDIDVSDVNIYWSASATAQSFDVYYSTDKAAVESNDPNVRIADDIVITQVNDVNSKLRSQTYYWRVVSNYTAESISGPTWSFVTRPYELVFNTRRNHTTSYQGYAIPALTCSLHSDGWTDVVTGTLDTDANVVVFSFPSGFNYDKRYDITVVPGYRAQDINSTTNVRPISLDVTGDFYFDGKIRLAGDSLLLTSNDTPAARSGGYPGPRHNSATTTSAPDNKCWDTVTINSPYYNRFNHTAGTTSTKDVYVADSNCDKYFGPGSPRSNPPYKGGAGGAYGGRGGNCGRGYYFGMNCYGLPYGGRNVPNPFGGSGGGWAGVGAGTSGGGGIEIIVSGDVVFDVNSEINADGGNALYNATDYPGGAGAGGSVKIIAGGSVTVKGDIHANGGKGGNSSKQANECGGGGGGGRIAIFYGTTYTLDDANGASITANGGLRGIYPNGGASLAEDGADGTVLVVKSSDTSPKTASAPTPLNGDKMVYCATNPATIQLKWYSGYGATDDRVWFGTSESTMTAQGTGSTPATRAQHSISKSVNQNMTYYWQIKTDSNSIESEVYSFSTVGWECPIAVAKSSSTLDYIGGPSWDYNGDCVVSGEDLWYFAKDWRVPRVSGTQDYTLDTQELRNILVDEWLLCVHRTNSGCTGW